MQRVPSPSVFYAHSANAAGHWHVLREHLASVGRLAAEFAAATHWGEEARLAGLLHDLGKYGRRFQARLRGTDAGLDHWSAGAWAALGSYQAVAAALAIQGHHVGLQAGNKEALHRLVPNNLLSNHPLGLALSDPDPNRLTRLAEAEGVKPKQPCQFVVPSWAHAVAAMLDVRLLFSCLVDADFLDTEAHFEGGPGGKRYRPAGPQLEPSRALAAIDAYVQASVRRHSQADATVRMVREALWDATVEAAQQAQGVYTLTAPTGAGKTLAMLRFALAHAERHELQRIVLAVPFLTIIEQTAKVYRAIFAAFPEHFVLEHHSLAGLGPEVTRADAEEQGADGSEHQRRLLAENWDAPIVLTTNVQLLESLFSNRPGACRKLHNLMGSVILFDEAQSLPQHLAAPTLAALSHLTAVTTGYRSTVLFATATQPAFDTLDQAVRSYAPSGWHSTEVAREHPAWFGALRRTRVIWPKDGETHSWDDLADELCAHAQVLCVVNLKRHAQALMDRLAGADGVSHLSTNLCPEHRRVVLEEIRTQLGQGAPCRLVSTQCVEAGVDVDFPRVYRAFGPLEAIAQAAGRCNREGRRRQPGEVVVFDPDEEGDWRRRYPTYTYFQAAAVTLTLLRERGHALDLQDPDTYRHYYRHLYDVTGPASQNATLQEAIQSLDFASVAAAYRLIDQDAIQVLVPWSAQRERYEELCREAEQQGITGAWMRRAQGLAVSLYRPHPKHPAWGVLVPVRFRRRGVSPEWFILEDRTGNYYDEVLGLRLPESEQVFIA